MILQKSICWLFLIIINVGKTAVQGFCGNWYIFSGFFDEQKLQQLAEIEIFCSILNVFIVTFNQLNASLLIKKYVSGLEKRLTYTNQNMSCEIYTTKCNGVEEINKVVLN